MLYENAKLYWQQAGKPDQIPQEAFSDAVEANKARTKAKMKGKPEAKARGDTIEEGLEEAIDVGGSSSK
uniref:Uncharacterized protein n=1 Tax=Romanomermis culicivorax TaxID=13658 RepID=A0A915IMF0_ROMCU